MDKHIYTVAGTGFEYSNVAQRGFTFRLRFLPGNFTSAQVAYVPAGASHEHRAAVTTVLERRARRWS